MTDSDVQQAGMISGAAIFIITPQKETQRDIFLKESLMMRQALSLCVSIAEGDLRIEAAFFEAVRVIVMRLMNHGTGRKFSLPEINARINELLKQSINSGGVINLFSDIPGEVSIFDTEFLADVAGMKA